MASMRRRVEGSAAVPASVRFADVPRLNPNRKAQEFFSQLPTNGISVKAPTQRGLMNNALVFLPLITWAFLQGVTLPHEFPDDSVPGFPIAVGVFWTLYSFREHRRMSMGSALGYTFASFLAGALAGDFVESMVRVDLHPLGAMHSPATVVGEFTLMSLWATATLMA
ncbi:unnamed protein product [Ostreobium quekettii]|uniref:Uncharacterized protein n=1 Tax=Ostreobium quekettii TaxID=121088 RepID=A0A8S1IPA5_9CHLO|nr:unnamed protein product [Ostreobium quekettii]